MKLIREMPDLFRLVGRAPINSYFVREDDCLTLVDANLPGRSTRIVEMALRLELPIRRIALTHAHMNHTGSLDAICELLPGAQVFIGARESRLLEQDFSLDRTEPQTQERVPRQLPSRAHRIDGRPVADHLERDGEGFLGAGAALAGLTAGGVLLLDTKHRVTGSLCLLLVALGLAFLWRIS